MKKIYLLLISAFAITTIFAQIPAGYYDSATGTGYTLKTQLYNIIKNPNVTSYSGLWTAFETTDDRDNGKVWDMYSNCNFTFGDDQDTGTGGTSECEFYNREHSFPKNWFGGEVSPMYRDLFHIYPTDKKVNSVRSNYPYGETNSPTYTSSNGSKLGPCSFSGYTGTVFEPIDEYKGDFARSYFYMATTYESVISSWPGSDMLDGSSDKCFTTWALNLLIKWSTNDPVSQKEIDRNNAVYDIQGNRNPYIDHPGWVECVWNNNCTSTVNNLVSNNTLKIKIFPSPVQDIFNIQSSNQINKYSINNCLGQTLLNKNNVDQTNININISDLKSGFYFITTTDTYGQTTVSKFIKN